MEIDLARERTYLWLDYTTAVDDLNAEAVRADRTGRLGYIYLADLITGESPATPWEPMTAKIGRSVNPRHRVVSFGKTNVIMPYSVHLFVSFFAEDAITTERVLHQMFDQYRVKGEWFDLPYEVWSSIQLIWFTTVNAGSLVIVDMCGDHFTPMDFFEKYMADARQEHEAGLARMAAFYAENEG